MKQYVVVGGGIAGLSAAYYLKKNALTPIQVFLLEQSDTWGGKIRTDRIEGYVIEGGPDTFLATKPWGVNLCRELGLETRLFGTNPHQKNTYVLHRSRLKPLPEGLTMMIPTQFGPMIRTGLLTWPQKARMGLDFFLPSQVNGTDESLGEFVTRRLGRAAYENLIEPLMSGIYAGDGDKLSLRATFPYLHELEREHGGLVRGALAVRKKMALARQSNPNIGKTTSAPGSRSAFLTPQSGLAEIVEALLARLVEQDVDLRLNSEVVSLKTVESTYQILLANGEQITADGVILASPAFASGAILAELDQELSALLREIPYVSTATVSLAYDQQDLTRPLDGYGYVIPRREGRRALACTWTSTKFPHRAPQGKVLVRVFIGRAGQEDSIHWDVDELEKIARDEVAQTLGINVAPRLSRVYMWEKAMPQYNLGHPARLEAIAAQLHKYPGLALAGNGYRGIGIPDCIHSGETAANQLLSL